MQLVRIPRLAVGIFLPALSMQLKLSGYMEYLKVSILHLGGY